MPQLFDIHTCYFFCKTIMRIPIFTAPIVNAFSKKPHIDFSVLEKLNGFMLSPVAVGHRNRSSGFES